MLPRTVRDGSCGVFRLSPIFVFLLLYLCDMITNETRHIDLHLPQSWNQCTTEELEAIAAAIIQEQQRVDRYHPFDWQRVKLNVVLAVNGIEVTGDGLNGANGQSGENASVEWLLRRRGDKEPWTISTGQLLSLTEQLAWIDAVDAKGRPMPMPKMLWPYPERLWRLQWQRWKPAKDFYRPGELLDGLSWTQYRMANDWMEVYNNVSNALIAETQKHGQMTQERIERLSDLARQQDDARLEVLAQLFYVADPALPCGYRSAPRRLLRKINRVEWQVVLFWWSSMMQYLKEQYPKCFKSSKIKKLKNAKAPLPIELYTQSMAVLVTDLKLTEDEVNRLTAHVVLRRLNDMAVEAEEIEKLKHKK